MRPLVGKGLAVLLLLPGDALACTIIAVGKDASASGAPMVGHTEDSGTPPNDIRLTRVPRRKWPKGSMRPLYNVLATYPRTVDAERSPEYAPVDGQKQSQPLAHIPQVEETYAYWDLDYGLQNEMGLSMGESTCTAMTVGWPADPDKPYGYNKAGIEELSKIAMERCATARCAAQTMGDIAVELGFFSSDSGAPENPGYSGSSECLTIADTNEVWNFNILTGKNNASAIWAAERVPPNHVVAVANAFTIRRLNLSDSENFLYSPGVTKLAEEMGWWSPELAPEKDIFDFFYAYGWTPPENAKPANINNIIAFYSGRRMWRIFSLLSPAEGQRLDPNRGNVPHTKDPYPGSVPAPSGSVTAAMVQNVFRDHYEGTPYDLTVGMAAGPYGNPNRGPTGPLHIVGQWERALSMYRATWSFVCEARPRGRSLVWFGYDAPHGTAYLPFFGAAAAGAPESYRSHEGGVAKFSFKVAWWAFNLINQYADLNFRVINAEVRSKASEVEARARSELEKWEHEADHLEHLSPNGAMQLLTDRSNEFAEGVVKEWWDFAFHLITKYRGYIITNNATMKGGNVSGQLVPLWWLESADVGYTLWSASGPYHGHPDPAETSSGSRSVEAHASSAPPQGAGAPSGSNGMSAIVAAIGGVAAVAAAGAALVAFQAGRRYGQKECAAGAYMSQA